MKKIHTKMKTGEKNKEKEFTENQKVIEGTDGKASNIYYSYRK